MTAALLAQALGWLFVVLNVVLCVVALYAGGRLHAVEGRENYRQVPNHVKRGVMMCFSVPIGTAGLAGLFPEVFRGAAPPVVSAAMWLCAVGATLASIYFVLGAIKTFASKGPPDRSQVVIVSGDQRRPETAAQELHRQADGHQQPARHRH